MNGSHHHHAHGHHSHGHAVHDHPHCHEPEKPEPPLPSGPIEWVCPMHPEVRSDKPGACPKCGMALEPRTLLSAEDPENPELRWMTRAFWVCALFTVPLVVIGMGSMFAAPSHGGGFRWRSWIELLLATPVVLWGGRPFFQRAIDSVRHRSPNMFTLIGLGTGAAYLFSVLATFAPRLFPASMRAHDGSVHTYFEAAAVITTLVLLGQVLELRARQRTSGAIRALLQLAPKTARRLLAGGGEEDVPVEHLVPGDRVRVRPGERVAVDGVVVEGESAVDESTITGEPIPVSKTLHDGVVGGTLNTTGTFVFLAERVGRETLLARIVEMVAEAQRSRAPIQRLADRVAAWFVPAVVVIAISTFVVWALVGPEPRLAHGFVNAVAVLIIACPCALGLATPMSIMVGVGRGAHAGVLVKDAAALETLARVDTFVVDKTGTLTEGRPQVEDLEVAGGFDPNEVLLLAASLERGSEHPLAAAIVAAAEKRSLRIGKPTEFTSVPGRGIEGAVDGKRVVVGTLGFVGERGQIDGTLQSRAEALQSTGRSVVAVAIDGKPAGLIVVRDPIRATSPEAVRLLRQDGTRIVMATGDGRVAATAVARELGIEEVHAELLPQDKVALVDKLHQQGRIVGMAGDGVNDAPALARADVGIVMGTGSDVAIGTGGITLVGGDLRGLVRARRLSRATLRNIRQNLFFAFVYNSIGVPVAAGVLYPVFGLLLSPMVASAAMSLSSVSVIANALRLRSAKL